MSSGRAIAVVQRHIDAVAVGTDPAAVARDYAAEAVLVRPGTRLVGRPAIAAYFRQVPARLGDGRVTFGTPVREGDQIAFDWRIVGGPADGTSGTDRCTVIGDVITEQMVTLHDADF